MLISVCKTEYIKYFDIILRQITSNLIGSHTSFFELESFVPNIDKTVSSFMFHIEERMTWTSWMTWG